MMLQLRNVSQTEIHCQKTISKESKGVTVPRWGTISFTQEEFQGNPDVAGKLRLGILRPIEVPDWAVEPLKQLGAL